MVVDWKLPPPPSPGQLAAMMPATTEPGAKPPPGAPGGRRWAARRQHHRLVQLAFIEGDPRPAWDVFRAYAKAIEAGGKGKVSFAAPYVKTVVGTDTYVDQIW